MEKQHLRFGIAECRARGAGRVVGLELDQSKGGDTGEDEVSGTLAVRKDEPLLPPSPHPFVPCKEEPKLKWPRALPKGDATRACRCSQWRTWLRSCAPCTRLGRTPHPTPILAGAAGAGVASALSAGGGGGTLWPVMRATAGRGRWRPTFAPSVEKKLVPLGPDLCRYRCTLATCPPGKLPTERLRKGKSPPSTPPLPPMTEFPAPQSWT